MNYSCVLLFGDDTYTMKKNLDLLLKTNEINQEDIETYDYEEDGIEKIITSAMTLPFLSEKKAVIMRNCSFLTDKRNLSKEDNETLTRYCSYTNPTTLFIMLAPYEKLDSRKNIVKYLTKAIDNKQFSSSKESSTIYEYIQDEVRKNGLSIDPLALTQFVNRIGNNTVMLENELQKLITYSLNKKSIDSDMVYEIVTKDIDDNIFDLVNAVTNREISKAMDIYNDLKSIKIDPIWMLASIGNKLQEILYTKELLRLNYRKEDIMKYFKASSGRVYYMIQNANNVEDQLLIDTLSKVEELDYQIKSGQIDKFLGIELFILSL
jgi:DNA polymerase-3 subunit delta